MKKVAVAMSGGVDSSVAALLLKKQGYDVTGITLKLFDNFIPQMPEYRGCCSLSTIEDARAIANHLNIPFYVLNFQECFKEYVIENFCASYLNGLTPNPCIECNRWIKFDFLLKKVIALGFDFLATGHYAIKGINKKSGEYYLKKSIDKKKDQTYFLYMMTQKQLKYSLFPVGGYYKSQIRDMAKNAELKVAHKPDSLEICFVTSENYGDYIYNKYPEKVQPGKIKEKNGTIIGEHHGIIHYTIGQRKMLNLTSKTPRYVTKIDANTNTIFVADKNFVYAGSLISQNNTFISGRIPKDGTCLNLKIRYNAHCCRGQLFRYDKDAILIKFQKKQRAVTPGQSVVFYISDKAIGGGIIKESL